MHSRNFLIIALDADLSAPGIVFKTLISSMSASCRITLLSEKTDPGLLSGNIRHIALRNGIHGWRRAEKKWKRIGCNPQDERWARRTFRKEKEAIFQERYDAIITFVANGYYSVLNLGKILKEHLRCPWVIYSVDGMPSPLPWLNGDTLLHGNISARLRLLCADADLFLMPHPQMIGYQKSVIPDFKGEWDYLYGPYRDVPEDFRLQPHEGLNILYAGSLYGLRRIDGLVEAFRAFHAERPDARLIFVGDVWKRYKALCQEDVQAGTIIFKDATDRIEDYYALADCLVDIAADIPDDVFLSSKVVCYLPYRIPIIAISGDNSPVSRIMGGVGSILQCHNRADEILPALRAVQGTFDFADRNALLEQFGPDYLCRRFLAQLEGQIGKRQPLIVTLTTWKARFANIPAVLDSIFAQTLPPDKVVINLSEDEILPEELRSYLDAHGVEVFRLPDTKVYKKLIPTLKRYPDACVVSIDDDWIYPPGMLEDFMRVHQQHPDSPISGNRVRAFHLNAHCGCASLTERRYFGDYLDWVDDEVMRNCPSDDIVYTYLARRNGYGYIRTRGLYFDNMTPYNPSEPYSVMDGTPVQRSWDYLTGRFGPVAEASWRDVLRKISSFLFELNRDQHNRKYLRLFGITIFLEKTRI